MMRSDLLSLRPLHITDTFSAHENERNENRILNNNDRYNDI